MKNAKIIFTPNVDAAIIALIDYVDLDEIPAVINFLDDLQERLVKTLSAFPEGGAPFKDGTRMMSVRKYTFLYEYHADLNEVHVLDMIAPGQDWR